MSTMKIYRLRLKDESILTVDTMLECVVAASNPKEAMVLANRSGMDEVRFYNKDWAKSSDATCMMIAESSIYKRPKIVLTG